MTESEGWRIEYRIAQGREMTSTPVRRDAVAGQIQDLQHNQKCTVLAVKVPGGIETPTAQWASV